MLHQCRFFKTGILIDVNSYYHLYWLSLYLIIKWMVTHLNFLCQFLSGIGLANLD